MKARCYKVHKNKNKIEDMIIDKYNFAKSQNI